MEQNLFIYLLWEKIMRNFTHKYLKTNILAQTHLGTYYDFSNRLLQFTRYAI